MDNEKIKQFMWPILITVAALVIAVILGMKLATAVQDMMSYKADIAAKEQSLKESQKKLSEFQEKERKEAKQNAENAANSKPFYKPAATGMNTEAVIQGEFAEILELIRVNRIKVRTIKYDYDPQDDAFVKGAGGKYKAARLNMEMVANYTSYNNFLKELYKHDHFLDIQSVEIVPYRKNKQILLINFKLKLYSQES
jgi:mannitol-specific phosphotransferase system IIBC component